MHIINTGSMNNNFLSDSSYTKLQFGRMCVALNCEALNNHGSVLVVALKVTEDSEVIFS